MNPDVGLGMHQTKPIINSLPELFPRIVLGADIRSEHDLVIMTFRVSLKNTVNPKNIRNNFNVDCLKDPTIYESFQATIGEKFAPLFTLSENAEMLTTEAAKAAIVIQYSMKPQKILEL